MQAHIHIHSRVQYARHHKGTRCHLVDFHALLETATVGICGLMQRDYLEFPDLGFAFLPEAQVRDGHTVSATYI